MRATPAILLLLAWLTGACAPEVPAEPTWIDDVRPIMAANCIRCHSPPYIGRVPTNFRLDLFEDDLVLQSDGTTPVHGAAYTSSDGTLAGVVDNETMPPVTPLTGRQIDVLLTWHEVGEPKGAARDGNSAPTMSLTSDLDIDPGRVGFFYEIADADGDIVTGVILADPGGGADPDPIAASNEIFVGRGAVRFSLPTGTYELIAELDDGHERVTVELGMAVVP